jgi:arylsulfatase
LTAVLTALTSADAEIVENLLADSGFENLSSDEPASGGTPWSDNISAAPAHIEARSGVAYTGTNSVAFNHYTRTGYLSQTLGIQVEADTSYELSVWMMIDEKSSNSSHTEAATLNMTLASSTAEFGIYDWIGGGAAHKDTIPTVVGEWQRFVFEIDSSVLTAEVGRWLEVRFVKENAPTEYRIFLDDASFGIKTSTTTNEQPNVLLILMDDLGYSDFGCYGSEIRTPTIDALASNGVRFRNFYNGSRCSPSRISLLSGLYPQQAAIDPSASLPTLRTDNNITLPELLSDNGYRTYMAGKWHVGFGSGQLPSDRGFQHVYTSRGSDFWTPGISTFVSENNEIAERSYGADPYDFHMTDVCADYSLDFLAHHAAQNDGKSFFLYMAFNAPHFPLAVSSNLVETAPAGEQSYLEIYRNGWNSVRQSRFSQMGSLGVLDAGTVLPGFSDTPYNGTDYWPVPQWETLSADRQEDLARRMGLYAGMIEQIDSAVARVTDYLEQTGQIDNTIIFILSDNGGNAEGGLYGRAYNTANHDPLTGTQLASMGQPGMSDGIYLGGGWANVANTPFRYYKRYTHGGGIRTPFIIHWPDGVQNPGRWTDQTGHLVDLTATIVDVLGLDCPEQYDGHSVLSWEGNSLLPAITNEVEAARQFGFEHESNRAWVDGDWKLVTKIFTSSDYSSFANTLELYDLSADPTELNNVAMDDPDKLLEMIAGWNAWARRVGVPEERLLALPALDRPAAMSVDLLLDTFNRSEQGDVDFSTNGISGRLVSALETNLYYEGYEGSGTPESIYVADGSLRMAVGGGMSENGLMHNFVDGTILSNGGFSVEMDVLEISGSDDEILDRYAGFGVGLTEAEAAAGGDISGSLSFRGRSSNPVGRADFFAELDMDGNVKVWSMGQLLATLPVGSVTGQLMAAFSLDGFETNSTVDVSVYFDGVQLDINTSDSSRLTQSFSWEHSGQNHVGLSARATDRAVVDNLSIRTFPLGRTLAQQSMRRLGLNGDEAALEGDPDDDGYSSYLEWLIGGNPVVVDEDLRDMTLLSVPIQETPLRLQVRRINEELAGGEMIDSVLVSTNLYNWEAVEVSIIDRADDPEQDGYEYLELELPEYIQQHVRLFMAIRYK